ncbi:MAG: alpha/beta hydrolase [Thermoflexales bacterium]|nr:alpha/beta hydrolase [Thermoflexales bacterium]
MTISSVERKARAVLPVVRFMQAYLPLPVAHWLLKQSMARLRLDYDVTREAVSADGVSCEWVIPQNSPTGQVLLYLHGGGFVFGLTPLHLQMGAYLAHKMGMRILMVDYRLAPNYPFPAALDDCATAYRWLLKQGISAQNIVATGDSAGGNLTMTLLMKLRDSGDPLPAAAACLSPVTDLTKDNVHQGYQDPLLPPQAMRFYTKSYVGNNDAHDPLISPVFGNLRGLPPLLIHAGEDEILCDDAVRIEELAKAAGVEVRLEIYPRMWHVWQLYLALPQAIQSLDDIAQFLRSHIGPWSSEHDIYNF